jgi:hypothetical protein
MIFGLIAAVLLCVEAILSLVYGAAYVASGEPIHPVNVVDGAVVLFVFGVLVGLLSLMGASRGARRSFVVGIALVVLAIVGFLAFGLSRSLLTLFADILTLVAGAVFLMASG